jgi:hypothetical protein
MLLRSDRLNVKLSGTYRVAGASIGISLLVHIALLAPMRWLDSNPNAGPPLDLVSDIDIDFRNIVRIAG